MKLKQKFGKKEVGFTLIEMLVVIAIIGVLSGILLLGVKTYKMRARDAQRISDLNKIVGALELYYTDHHYFPPAACGYDCASARSYSYDATSWNALATALQPYLGTLPVDPINSTCQPQVDNCYSYSYANVGRYVFTPGFDLTGQLETPGHPLSCGKKDYGYLWHLVAHECSQYGGSHSNQLYEAIQ